MRARSSIVPGLATLENRWLKRVWCGSFGHTLELCSPGDWLHSPGQEFGLAVGDSPITSRNLLETELSELATPEGAGLIARHAGGDWHVEVRSLLLHDAPVLVRQVYVMYHGKDALSMERVALELLPMQQAVSVLGNTTRGYTALLENDAVLLVGPQGGLALGSLGTVTCQCFEPNPGMCSLVYEMNGAWEPGRRYAMPLTFVGAMVGNDEEAWVKEKENIVATVRSYWTSRKQEL